MLKLRRNSHTARVEMTPLIDVIFLLLTFFIYSLVVSVRAQIMPVSLTPIDHQAAPDTPTTPIDAITISSQGRIYFNRAPISLDELPKQLETFATTKPQSRLFVAMESSQPDGLAVDRGPMLIRVMEMIRQAGIENMAIVGQPDAAANTSPDNTRQPSPVNRAQ